MVSVMTAEVLVKVCHDEKKDVLKDYFEAYSLEGGDCFEDFSRKILSSDDREWIHAILEVRYPPILRRNIIFLTSRTTAMFIIYNLN